MSLVWKLLRQHISVPQFVGFAVANLVGMCIVLLGCQIYFDVVPVLTGADSFMKTDYLILSKAVGTGSTISGRSNAFDNSEMEELQRQPFVKRMGRFTTSAYKVDGRMGVAGTEVLNTELFLESIPDAFVDAPSKDWHFSAGDREVPIILPRSYIAMYNFGFAQSRRLPKISDGLVGMIDLRIFVRGNGRKEMFKGRVIGFSNRLSAILVPQSFMDWSNARFAPGQQTETTRVVVDAVDAGSEKVTKYIDRKGYEVENGQLEAEKTTYLLRLMMATVMVVGLVISTLSFYILMLSIYLLVQKNTTKLENLLLIGYSPVRVAKPYQWLTISLNVSVLLLAWVVVMVARHYYIGIIGTLFPDADGGSLMPAILLGLSLFGVVSVLNMVAIRRKIVSIWKRKE